MNFKQEYFTPRLAFWSSKIYSNIYFAFLSSWLLSYFTLLYMLPYILEFSYILGAILLTLVFGLSTLITLTTVIKLFVQMNTLFKISSRHIARQIMNAKNTFYFTYSRYS